MESLFRWSKFVPEDQVEQWENRLIGADVPYTVEKLIHRENWQFTSYCATRREAESLREIFGGGVSRVDPESWEPSASDEPDSVLKIRDRIIVSSSIEEEILGNLESEYEGRIVLSFPPQLAFGTGTHPTTAGCLRFLADYAGKRENKPWRVLDLGCGSGILSVAAVKLGAKEVVAVENDEMALRYAVQNGERHGVKEAIDFVEGDAVAFLKEGNRGIFDLIVANLFSELLIGLLPLFAKNTEDDAEIILSGFLTSQAASVTAAAKQVGFPLKDFQRRGNWVAGRGVRAIA